MKARSKTYVIRRVEQLAALSSPARCRIAETLSAYGPSSVREIAARIDRVPESLYYHVRALEKVGLVVLDGRRKAGRRQEAVYRLVAPRLVADRKQRSIAYKDALARSCDAFMRLASRDHRAAIDRGFLALDGPRRNLSVRRRTARLSPTDLARLNRLIDRAFDLLEKRDQTDGGERCGLTVVLTPLTA